MNKENQAPLKIDKKNNLQKYFDQDYSSKKEH